MRGSRRRLHVSSLCSLLDFFFSAMGRLVLGGDYFLESCEDDSVLKLHQISTMALP